jgi:lipoprotein-anchoring transpeptidase ErfK/SrfK
MRRPARSAFSRLVGTAAAALTLAMAAACSSGASANNSWHGPGGAEPSAGGSSSDAASSSAITVLPAANAANASVTDPVTVSIDAGSLETVTMTNQTGKQVKGAFDTDHKTWHTTENLGYSKTYTINAAGTGADGKKVAKTSSFSTVKPREQATVYLRSNGWHLLKEKQTYGVGQPVIVYFDKAVTDRAAVERTLTVTTEPTVEGRWHWFDNRELHWRPAAYWKTGTKVTVKADIYGKNLGNGVYGRDDASASFSIGQSKIAIADSNTKHMKVYFDGALVRDIPVSLGKGGTVKTPSGQTANYWTNSGAHVVMEKTPTTHMSSIGIGITDKEDPNYYDTIVKLTVRISASGEFVHMADWNIPAHGHRNTSHGCVNVGPVNAQWFYDNFNTGDVVEVRNTPRPLDPRNGVGDWVIPWDKW